PSPRPTAPSASASPAASASPSAAAGGTAAAQVLALINQARSAAGLPALTITSGLETSSSQHNLLMADGCGLSHQCPGEAPLGDRETAAGVDWTSAGENIGEGGPVADTDAAIAQMAVGLTQSMLNEQPPDDGHRLNILSSSFTHIGIAVYRDSSGTVWLTQDFSN
ncbi:MAG: CAP domain-containing protein, partial [Trebonia sp.]